MKTAIRPQRSQIQAYITLPAVLFFTGLSLVVLGSTMTWTATSTRLTDRNVQYYNAAAAAEAATEQAITYMFRDFRYSAVKTNLDAYQTNIPSSPELTSRFQFLDANSNANRLTVLSYYPHGVTNAETNFQYGYKLIANARSIEAATPVPAAVRQIVTFSNDPIFRYAIFYAMNLEICPGRDMIIIGKVHSQRKIFYSPAMDLIFRQNVTAVGDLINHRDPESDLPDQDGTTTPPPPPNLFMAHAPTKSLPLETTNIHSILEVPPGGEPIDSQDGKLRYYNNVDMILTIGNTNMVAETGPGIPTHVTVTNGLTSFIQTNASFYNGRENKTVKPTDINIGGLNTWLSGSGSALNSAVNTKRGHIVNSIYVNDLRTRPSTNASGVRLKNGQTLPAAGLTVVTDDPIYVQGHFNALTPGSTNTVGTKPASLVGDAVTVLSTAWVDSQCTSTNNWYKGASSTTVNAAFLAGIVPSKHRSTLRPGYSGGVENFPRFLEDWGSDTFTYNGSMVVLFASQYATNTWCRADGQEYYSPPTRNWAFDVNYLQPAGLPPCTPQLRTLVRDRLELVKTFSTD
jgi:hypothetical protein